MSERRDFFATQAVMPETNLANNGGAFLSLPNGKKVIPWEVGANYS